MRAPTRQAAESLAYGIAAAELRAIGYSWAQVGLGLEVNSKTAARLAATALAYEALTGNRFSVQRHDQDDNEHDELDRHTGEQHVDHDDGAAAPHAVALSSSQ